jgi:hypothetical protein
MQRSVLAAVLIGVFLTAGSGPADDAGSPSATPTPRLRRRPRAVVRRPLFRAPEDVGERHLATREPCARRRHELESHSRPAAECARAHPALDGHEGRDTSVGGNDLTNGRCDESGETRCTLAADLRGIQNSLAGEFARDPGDEIVELTTEYDPLPTERPAAEDGLFGTVKRIDCAGTAGQGGDGTLRAPLKFLAVSQDACALM